jgi:hypothetical protein
MSFITVGQKFRYTQLVFGSPELPATVPSPELPATVPSPELLATVPSPELPATVPSPEPPATVNGLEPPATVNSLEPPATVNSLEPPATVNGLEPPATVNSLEPPAMVNSLEPLATVKARRPVPLQGRSLPLRRFPVRARHSTHDRTRGLGGGKDLHQSRHLSPPYPPQLYSGFAAGVRNFGGGAFLFSTLVRQPFPHCVLWDLIYV